MEKYIAYFSMEIGLTNDIPTYSGGLGVLAGDTIRSAADMKVPMVAITLLYRDGYFYQRLDAKGQQSEEPVKWVAEDFLESTNTHTVVSIEGRDVHLHALKYEVHGVDGYSIPVYLLDSDHPKNKEEDRGLTAQLYGGDKRYRLCQEVILGIGGAKILRELGYDQIKRFHMNEGHASLLTLELLNEQLKKSKQSSICAHDLEIVRNKCVFTTHTPVPAGHDKFPMELVRQVMGYHPAFDMPEVFCCEGILNMTYLALNLSHYTNGVAKKHGEVSKRMLTPKNKHIHYEIDSITNGVHADRWVSEPFRELFDRYIPNWREDNFNLRYALSIPNQQIWDAHTIAKKKLITRVNRETNTGMDVDIFTLGFARRATAYKRPDLIFQDIERLQKIMADFGELQIVFAGKAHPQDNDGKQYINRIFQARDALRQTIKVAYLENYDIALGQMLTAGVDVWLNTPEPPMEASGTSGMKAALNGVPSLSILDGWWIEGCIEGITGWAIGNHDINTNDSSIDTKSRDAEFLYAKLEKSIMPLFYNDRNGFTDIMTHAIALNGSFFNTQRMMQQYVVQAYR